MPVIADKSKAALNWEAYHQDKLTKLLIEAATYAEGHKLDLLSSMETACTIVDERLTRNHWPSVNEGGEESSSV